MASRRQIGVDVTRKRTSALRTSGAARRVAGEAIEAGRTRTSKRFKPLTSERRGDIPTEQFAIPERRVFPIQSRDQAKVALRFVRQRRGNPADFPRVIAAIRRKYPDLVGEA